jgi:glyoxylase-like metal-dependent hydrolase (beta-lactamase superfamily II)
VRGERAHTPGDLVVHVPDAAALFAADVLFVGCTPIMWVGPLERWLAALDVISELGPRTVVPSHGPITDLGGVRAVRGYWEFVAAAVRERVAAGMKPEAAAGEIVRSPEFRAQELAGWDNPERIVVNAAAIARTDRGEQGRIPDRERTALLGAAGKLGLGLRGAG